MAMTWQEILDARGIDKIAEIRKMLEEKGMTLGEFMASEEAMAAAEKAAYDRFARPFPYEVVKKEE